MNWQREAAKAVIQHLLPSDGADDGRLSRKIVDAVERIIREHQERGSLAALGVAGDDKPFNPEDDGA